MKKIDDILEPGGVINLNADVENPHFEFLILVATAVQKLIDAHNELLETHTEETSNLGFIRQYLGEVPPDRTFTAKELWEVFNAFAPLMTIEQEKEIVEAIKGIETHTVKEERVECHCGNGVDCPEECCALCECATYEDGVHTKSTCNTPIDCPCHKEEVKEEKTTPDKKCCDDCKKYELGVNCQCVCHGVLPRHQGEKLTTSSYEVTCGRCEKSIKHSCGRV